MAFGPPPALGQGAKGGAAPPLRPPTTPITPRFPRAAPPCSARLGRAACATASLMPGVTAAGPTAPISCRVPCSAFFMPSQVLRAFAVSFCPMLVRRQRTCVRRGWGVPLRDYTPLCRAQLPKKSWRAFMAVWHSRRGRRTLMAVWHSRRGRRTLMAVWHSRRGGL